MTLLFILKQIFKKYFGYLILLFVVYKMQK